MTKQVALDLAWSPRTVKIKWLFFNASIRYLRVRNAALITTIQKTIGTVPVNRK